MTPIALLLDRCGLSRERGADYLGVRPDTIKSWRAGKNPTPPAVLDELRGLYARIERAADEAIAAIREAPEDAEIEAGIAADDPEAQSLGWPCVGAQAAMLGLVVARLDRPVRIVPRGSTPATAAAIEARKNSRLVVGL